MLMNDIAESCLWVLCDQAIQSWSGGASMSDMRSKQGDMHCERRCGAEVPAGCFVHMFAGRSQAALPALLAPSDAVVVLHCLWRAKQVW